MIEKWMECFGAKDGNHGGAIIENPTAMALSYMQKAQLTAGLLANQHFNMTQFQEKQVSTSPPLHLNNNNNNNSSTANANPGANPLLLNNMNAAALSLLSSQQLMAARTAALMSVGLPITLQNSALYRHHQQNLFGAGGWTPPAASSPPSPHHPHHPLVSPQSPGGNVQKTASPAQHQTQRVRTPNNNNNDANVNNNNNNNTAKAQKRKSPGSNGNVQLDGNLSSLSSPSSPRNSSPESGSTGRGSANKEKVFQCQVCLKTFGYKHVLQNHERTHTGEKPYECNVCHKRFTRDHHLKTHYRLHTGDKPYNCKTCDRTFVQVANLRRHMRVHTGERPYACTYSSCLERFKDSNQLKNHLLKHECKNQQQQQPQQISQSPPPPTMILPVYHQQRLQSLSPAMSSSTVDEDADQDNKLVAAASINRRTHQPPVRLSMQLHRHHHQQQESQMMTLDLSRSTGVIPEQTEPEDLSVTSVVKKRRSDDSFSNCSSPLSYADDREYS